MKFKASEHELTKLIGRYQTLPEGIENYTYQQWEEWLIETCLFPETIEKYKSIIKTSSEQVEKDKNHYMGITLGRFRDLTKDLSDDVRIYQTSSELFKDTKVRITEWDTSTHSCFLKFLEDRFLYKQGPEIYVKERALDLEDPLEIEIAQDEKYFKRLQSVEEELRTLDWSFKSNILMCLQCNIIKDFDTPFILLDPNY